MKKIIVLMFACVLSCTMASAQKTYALITGVSNYEGEANDLQQSTKDAKMLAQLYKDKGATVYILTSKYATRDNIIAQIRRMARKVTAQDHVVFAYSGHGAPNKLCTYVTSGVEMLGYNELFAELSNTKAKDIVCYIDACFSGSASSNLTEKGMENDKAWTETLKANPRYALFLSSRENETSAENPLVGAGLMFNSTVKGLRGKADANGDKKITIIELFKYIHADVQEHRASQHPQLVTSKSLYNNVLMSW